MQQEGKHQQLGIDMVSMYQEDRQDISKKSKEMNSQSKAPVYKLYALLISAVSAN